MANYYPTRIILGLAVLISMTIAATAQSRSTVREKLIEQIRKTEKQFETDLNNSGAAYAFEKYAAPNAVIKRQQDSLIYGPAGIGLYYANAIYKNAQAHWSPDYIDISEDGTLAYTYGKYTWKITTATGEINQLNGVFHTVWKKQPDGLWRYVWD